MTSAPGPALSASTIRLELPLSENQYRRRKHGALPRRMSASMDSVRLLSQTVRDLSRARAAT